VAAVATITAHLPSNALNAGVRRAFGLTALSAAILALSQLMTVASYFDEGAPNAYKLGWTLVLVGSLLLACGYWRWSREVVGEPTPPE
jgi:uncharacterized membrane protein YidH (DUF202 family)